MTRHRDLLESELLQRRLAIFTDAERVIADPVVRNRGTIGGALCQADPSEDLSAVCAAVGAQLVIRGSARRARRRHATSSTAARTRPRSARPRCWSRSASRCTPAPAAPTRRSTAASGDWAVVAAGAAIELDGRTGSRAPGIALAAVGGDITSAEADASLLGERPTPETLRTRRGAGRGRVRARHRPARIGGVQTARRRRPDGARPARADRAGARTDERRCDLSTGWTVGTDPRASWSSWSPRRS